MMEDRRFEEQALGALQKAVTEALERKRRLGQYAVVWEDGRLSYIGPDAPGEGDRYSGRSSGSPLGVQEPSDDE